MYKQVLSVPMSAKIQAVHHRREVQCELLGTKLLPLASARIVRAAAVAKLRRPPQRCVDCALSQRSFYHECASTASLGLAPSTSSSDPFRNTKLKCVALNTSKIIARYVKYTLYIDICVFVIDVYIF